MRTNIWNLLISNLYIVTIKIQYLKLNEYFLQYMPIVAVIRSDNI